MLVSKKDDVSFSYRSGWMKFMRKINFNETRSTVRKNVLVKISTPIEQIRLIILRETKERL